MIPVVLSMNSIRKYFRTRKQDKKDKVGDADDGDKKKNE